MYCLYKHVVLGMKVPQNQIFFSCSVNQSLVLISYLGNLLEVMIQGTHQKLHCKTFKNFQNYPNLVDLFVFLGFTLSFYRSFHKTS